MNEITVTFTFKQFEMLTDLVTYALNEAFEVQWCQSEEERNLCKEVVKLLETTKI